MSKVSSFLLNKWYLDCLEPSGDGALVYVAELRWKALHVRYASTLTLSGNKIEIAASIRECAMPEYEGEKIVLRLPHLGVEGIWKGFAAPIERTIFDGERGTIQWNCFQPASQVAFTLNGKKAEGLGYAELLRITVPPWKLPLNELHWGRFVSESDALVWIDWRGPYRYRMLMHNGAEQECISITEHEVRSPKVSLALDQGLVLRSGELGKTVFPSIRRLATSVPASLLRVRECKWRSQGALRQAERSSGGWAIHEVVRWRRE